mmetsp:Transcript_144034/g.461004  ORF Transcript_144034/g.461004 Transcript_144034/m.461004 type:complete len:728 (-) Transcript_144034:121-2304(-)
MDGGRATGRQYEPEFGHMEAAVVSSVVEDLSAATKALVKLTKLPNGKPAEGDAYTQDLLTKMFGMLNTDHPFWPKDLAEIAFAMGKLQLTDPLVNDILVRVGSMAKYRAEQFSPNDVAGIVWGFASYSMRNEAMMSVIAAEVVNKISRFQQRELSNTAWAFAKCGLWNEQLVSAIAGECLAKIRTFSVQSISHISWALAQWGTRKEELMNAIAQETIAKANDFSPSPLAMTAWSFASLQFNDRKLMSAISERACDTLSDFKSQDLAHLAWAFANLRISDSHLFNKMAVEVQRNIKEASPPELANIAWAFAKNNVTHEDLMCAIAQESAAQISQFKAAEIAMLTWAFAVSGLRNKHLMAEIGSQVFKTIHKFSAPQLSHIAWAFGALSLRHSDFLNILAAHVGGGVSSFKAQGLSNIAWAFAMVTFRDEVLLRKIAPCITQNVSELRPLALARCAWAYRVLAIPNPELMMAIGDESLRKVAEFPSKALVKLCDALFVSPMANDGSSLRTALDERLAEIAAYFRRTWPPSEPFPQVDGKEYETQMQEFGMSECGIVGTPLLLERLDIELPGAKFMQKCITKAWEKDEETKPQSEHNPEEYTAAHVNVTLGTEPLEAWVVHYNRNSNSPGGEKEADEPTYLQVCALPTRQGRHESAFGAIEEIAKRIFELGGANSVAPGAAEVCPEATGSVQMVTTVVPCITSIGAWWQFKILFPNVTFEFAEQVGTIGY